MFRAYSELKMRALYEAHPQIYQTTPPNLRAWGEIIVLYWGA